MQVVITEELGLALKEIRKANKVKAVDISDHIKKSPTYFSKIESASIKTIDSEELENIFKFIFKDKGDFTSRFQEFIGKHMVNRTDEELRHKLWLINFDTVICKIPIPSELVDFCIDKMKELEITIAEIVERINENEDIVNELQIPLADLNQEPHSWFEKNGEIFILINESTDTYEKIFAKKTNVCNFITMYAFLYNMLKSVSPSFDEARKAANSILRDHKFLSVEERNRALKDSLKSAMNTQKRTDIPLSASILTVRYVLRQLIVLIFCE